MMWHCKAICLDCHEVLASVSGSQKYELNQVKCPNDPSHQVSVETWED